METKIVLITGGNRGLGRDMALSVAKKGMDVIFTYHSNEAEAKEVIAEILGMGQKAVALQFNVSNILEFDEFLILVLNNLKNYWGTDKFDFLVNNAGIGSTLPISDVTEEVFDNLMNIHYKGVYFLTQKSIPMLNDNGGVIFISSGTTRFCVPGYSVYSSLKGAVEIFCKYVAKEYGKRGIRSNIVAPGAIETDFNNAAIRTNPQMKSFLANQTALGRVGNADDVGSVVAFLCTEEAKWINAQRIEVSGGMFL